MSGHSHNDSISLPRYKSKHTPKLSLLPFEIYAPSSQLSPPLGWQENIYDEYFSPSIQTPPEVPPRSDMRYGTSRHDKRNSSQSEARRKKHSSSKKHTPANQRFPEFVPHHSRNNSSSSTWAKSSTSSATLAIAETRTILSPPRKGSQINVEDIRKMSQVQGTGKFTGDNRVKKNYSMPRVESSGDQVDYDAFFAQLAREGDHTTSTLIPHPLEGCRKPSFGSLQTPLPVPGDVNMPPPVHQFRNPLLAAPIDMPRKDSSTIPWGNEKAAPTIMPEVPERPYDKYRSQILGNPFLDHKAPHMPSPIYEEKVDVDSWPLPLPVGRKSRVVDRHSILKLELGALDMTDASSIYTARKTIKPYSYFVEEPESKYTKVKKVSKSCWGRWSTRQLILAATAIIVLILLAIGLSTGLIFTPNRNAKEGLTPTWRPAIGNTWQIQVGEVNTTPSLRAQVYDIDLFANNASRIEALHKMGRRVICSFSAGTFENWQPDAASFKNVTIGNSYQNSPNETWLDTSLLAVRTIMKARIKLAKTKGCDGVGPDNVDGYRFTGSNGTGFSITEDTSADFVRYLAHEAHTLDLAIGLNNSPELINKTLDVIEWQLNEGCASNGNCELFQPFIEAGKPVFHVEYANNASVSVLNVACGSNGTQHFSTLIKKAQLDGWAVECPIGESAYGME